MSDDKTERSTAQTDEADAPPTEAELEQARAFAEALDEGNREVGTEDLLGLVETVEMIRAGTRPQPGLTQQRRDELVDAALARQAASGPPAKATPPSEATSPAQRQRFVTRLRQAAPLLALAATVLLVIGAVLAGLPLAGHRDNHDMPGSWPTRALSRPSDDLLGRPIKDRGGASRRLDRVFADRVAGYRLRVLAGR